MPSFSVLRGLKVLFLEGVLAAIRLQLRSTKKEFFMIPRWSLN